MPHAAFLSGQTLTAAQLNAGFGTLHDAWVTWVPTLTNLTLGNGAVIAKSRKVGKTLDWRFLFTLGSTSAVSTGPKFTLPFAPHSDYIEGADVLGRGVLLDSGTGQRDAAARLDSGSTLEIVAYSSTGDAAAVTATAPWTWTTDDKLSVAGTIELA